MEQTNTVERRVLDILKACPKSRYDDMLLALRYYDRYGYVPAGELPFAEVMTGYKELGLPCFESIRRARQRVQSCFPEVSRNSQKNKDGDLVIVININ